MEKGKQTDNSRRDFIKKSAYVAPAILTLQAAPALAGTGSCDYKTRLRSGGSHYQG